MYFPRLGGEGSQVQILSPRRIENLAIVDQVFTIAFFMW